MEKQFGWVHNLGGVESLDLQGRSVLAKLTESQRWHQLKGSVALLREDLERGQWPLLALMPNTSVSSCTLLVPFKQLHWY